MSTLAEMAIEYRAASAKLALRIKEKKAAGAPRHEIQELEAVLGEMRKVQRTIAHYYTLPRTDCDYAAVGWFASRGKRDESRNVDY